MIEITHVSIWKRSSPHTRGARPGVAPCFLIGTIIPAYAGSTRTAAWSIRRVGDHPRIRGEHMRRSTSRGWRRGSSPHTRGALLNVDQMVVAERIIPAYAGSTPPWPGLRRRRSDHPRIRGEHPPGPATYCPWPGSSPHTRGALSDHDDHKRAGRIIPAYAGSTLGNPCNTKDRRRDYTSFPLPVTHPSGGGGS